MPSLQQTRLLLGLLGPPVRKGWRAATLFRHSSRLSSAGAAAADFPAWAAAVSGTRGGGGADITAAAAAAAATRAGAKPAAQKLASTHICSFIHVQKASAAAASLLASQYSYSNAATSCGCRSFATAAKPIAAQSRDVTSPHAENHGETETSWAFGRLPSSTKPSQFPTGEAAAAVGGRSLSNDAGVSRAAAVSATAVAGASRLSLPSSDRSSVGVSPLLSPEDITSSAPAYGGTQPSSFPSSAAAASGPGVEVKQALTQAAGTTHDTHTIGNSFSTSSPRFYQATGSPSLQAAPHGSAATGYYTPAPAYSPTYEDTSPATSAAAAAVPPGYAATTSVPPVTPYSAYAPQQQQAPVPPSATGAPGYGELPPQAAPAAAANAYGQDSYSPDLSSSGNWNTGSYGGGVPPSGTAGWPQQQQDSPMNGFPADNAQGYQQDGFGSSGSWERRMTPGNAPQGQGRGGLDTWGRRPREGFNSGSSTDGLADLGERRLMQRPSRDLQQRRQSFAGDNLVDIEWQQETLVPIRKNFYKESATVAARSAEEVAAIFREHQMHVKSYGGSRSSSAADGSSSSSGTVEGVPKPIMTFEEVGFPPSILNQLQRMELREPTAIQKIGWPVALSGRDMIGIAQTGSGKTLGFLLPGLVHAAGQAPLQLNEGPIVLVLAPTRELAMQIRHECNKFTSGLTMSSADVAQEEAGGGGGEPMPERKRTSSGTQVFRTACVYGGVPRQGQAAELRRGAEIVIATPGRLLDFLEMGVTNLKRVSYVVLDEADRMMDMGFEPQVRKLFSQIRPDRQTLLWSATWPREVRDLARSFCRTQVVRLQIGDAELQASATITQRVEVVPGGQVQQRLLEVLQQMPGEKILIFCETKRQCDQLCRELRYRQMRALAIHGDKEQRERDRILHDFRVGHCEILVATDVASRGLDIRDVRYVINYEMPKNIESYIHRIGRTGRAGNSGTAISFFEYDYYQPEKVNMAKRVCDVMRAVGQNPPQELVRIAQS